MVRARVVGAALQTQAGLNRRLGSRADMFGAPATPATPATPAFGAYITPRPSRGSTRVDDVAFSSNCTPSRPAPSSARGHRADPRRSIAPHYSQAASARPRAPRPRREEVSSARPRARPQPPAEGCSAPPRPPRPRRAAAVCSVRRRHRLPRRAAVCSVHRRHRLRGGRRGCSEPRSGGGWGCSEPRSRRRRWRAARGASQPAAGGDCSVPRSRRRVEVVRASQPAVGRGCSVHPNLRRVEGCSVRPNLRRAEGSSERPTRGGRGFWRLTACGGGLLARPAPRPRGSVWRVTACGRGSVWRVISSVDGRGSVWRSAGRVSLAQPQASFLSTTNGQPVRHYTQWGELTPQSQQQLKQLEAMIMAARRTLSCWMAWRGWRVPAPKRFVGGG